VGMSGNPRSTKACLASSSARRNFARSKTG
jgi:hypothetical protein